MSRDGKHYNLSILLLKDDVISAEEAIKKGPLTREFVLKTESGPLGTLYVESHPPKTPKWAHFFENVMDISSIGKRSSVSAALLLEVDGRIFAMTFGHGRFLLKPDSWQETFGLRVALNCIGEKKVRSIDKRTFDAISRQSRIQASKEAAALDFGFDGEQDLLRAVTGAPRDHSMGQRMYGMDALSVSTDIVPGKKLEGFLAALHTKYQDVAYKRDFPWVDQIKEVRSKRKAEELDEELFKRVRANAFDRIWMAVPEIIPWEQVAGFCYRMGKTSPEYQDVHLNDLIESLRAPGDVRIDRATFDRIHVNCIHVEGYLLYKWQAYKCLYGEIDFEGDTYLLSGGKWYLISGDFVTQVNDAYREIPYYDVRLPEYRDGSEGEYNARVIADNPAEFALMDQKKISYGGGYSTIEFCDLYSSKRDIIHVKRYGSSSVLSHLFAQGRISGELFQMEAGFRNKVNDLLPDGYKISNPGLHPETNQYQIVFAIVSDVPGEMVLPFFSRLNLKNAARILSGLGYRVAKAKIAVNEEKAKAKKCRVRISKKQEQSGA